VDNITAPSTGADFFFSNGAVVLGCSGIASQRKISLRACSRKSADTAGAPTNYHEGHFRRRKKQNRRRRRLETRRGPARPMPAAARLGATTRLHRRLPISGCVPPFPFFSKIAPDRIGYFVLFFEPQSRLMARWRGTYRNGEERTVAIFTGDLFGL